ncbi:MAG: hypothetical protein WBA40_05665 [Roseiarcus sp.]
MIIDTSAATNPIGRNKLGDLTDAEFAASASKWAGYHESVNRSQGAGLGSKWADVAVSVIAIPED